MDMTDLWDDCTYIYRSMNFVDFYGINVGKYTVRPMDAMGHILPETKKHGKLLINPS